MANEKKSFLLYCDIIHTVEKLPDDKAGQLLKHILRYTNDLNPDTDDILIQLAFEPIKQALKRDLKKYEKKREINRDKANKRWKKNDATACHSMPQHATASNGMPSDAEHADIDSDSVIDSVSVNVSVSDNVLSNDNIKNEAFVAECLKSAQWCEVTAMQHKIKPEKLESVLYDFCVHLISIGSQKRDVTDFKEHLSNWLRKKDFSISNNRSPTTNNPVL